MSRLRVLAPIPVEGHLKPRTANEVSRPMSHSYDVPTGSNTASVLGIPAAGLAALPFCPACFPMYAGIFTSLGLTPLSLTGVQATLTLTLLAVSLAALAFRARARRGYTPLAVGCIGSLVVLIGKFGLGIDAMTYAGIGVLVLASVWNLWPLSKLDDVPGSLERKPVAL